MNRDKRIAELEEGGIYCSPEKVEQASVSGLCLLGMLVIVVGAMIFGERPPTQKPAQPTTQVATTR